MSKKTEIIQSEDAQQETKQSPLVVLGSQYNIDPKKMLDVLRGTVIKPDREGRHASNEEVAAFCIVANHYGLNPFTREIHAFTDKSRGVVPIVGVDGWAHLVNDRRDFNGCTFEEEADAAGRPVKVTCSMYVKGREHPVSVSERYSECKRDTNPWKMMPWRMLRHKAFIQAARYAFGLSGIYDEDEARDIVKNAAAITPPEIVIEASDSRADGLAKRLAAKRNVTPEETPEQVLADLEPGENLDRCPAGLTFGKDFRRCNDTETCEISSECGEAGAEPNKGDSPFD